MAANNTYTKHQPINMEEEEVAAAAAAASEEEVDAEQVRALAETLAPQEQELNQLMDDPLLYSNSSGDDIYSQTSNDDDMDQELEQLTYSEDILRRELDLAKDFASFFGSSFGVDSSPGGMLAPPTALFESPLPHAYAEVYSPEVVDDDDDEVRDQTPTLSNNSYISNEEIQQDEADMEHEDDQELQEEEEEEEQQLQSNSFDSHEVQNSAPHTTTVEDETNSSSTPQRNKPQQSQESYFTPTPTRHHKSPAAPPETPQTSVVLFRSPGKVYSSSEHFQRLRLNKEPQGAWYSVDLTAHVANVSNESQRNNNNNDDNDNNNNNTGAAYPSYVGMGIKEYCLSVSEWKHLFVGLKLEGDELPKQGHKQQADNNPAPQEENPLEHHPSQHTTPEKGKSPSISATTDKIAPVRTISIRIRPDVLCGAVMDAVTQTLANCPHSSIIKRQGGHLQGTVRGLVPPQRNSESTRRRSSRNNTNNDSQPRECNFLVDVQLCTHKSIQCERVLLLRIYHWKEDQIGATEDDLWSPSSAATTNAINTTIDSSSQEIDQSFGQEDSFLSLEESTERDQQANLHLREACALIQRIESPELARKIRPLSQKENVGASMNTTGVKDVVSGHLLQNYRACPSVLQPETAITLPALSPQDWPVIQSSWNWVQSVWDELETRELTFLSLLPLPMIAAEPPEEDMSGDDADAGFFSTSPCTPRFGAFPALPTLDVHYCSQLRRLSREAMIHQLLKAASVLEEYARQAEYQCANLIDLLRPTFVQYGVEPPSLPKPVPLAAYPLEYTPPQTICPPWGTTVMEALNRVAAMSHSAANQHVNEKKSPEDSTEVDRTIPEAPGDDGMLSDELESIDLADTAVQMVYEAFQKQDDEEQSARLARKNLQVMDRLSKMEEHHRASIRALGNSTTNAAVTAADEFYAKAETSSIGLNGISVEGEGEQICATPWREVPLLRWNMGVGGSSGTCTITANQIIFTPASYIPLLGRSQSIWFCLRDVEFRITQSQGSLLNPLCTMQVLHRSSGREAYSFRPSSPGPRLKSFLDILTKEATEIASRE